MVTKTFRITTTAKATLESNWFILRNFVIMNVGVVMAHVAYYVYYYLQPSMNSEGGVGNLALAVDYISQVVSCLVVPPLLIRKISCKWTLILSMALFVPYYFANLFPSIYSFLPTAVLLGIGMGTVWATFGTYVCTFAFRYADVSGADPGLMVSRFFAAFYMCIKLTAIISGGIAYALLSSFTRSEDNPPPADCGFKRCPNSEISSPWKSINLENTTKTNTTDLLASKKHDLTVLCSVLIGIAVFGLLLLSIFLTKIDYSNADRGFSAFSSTFRLMKSPDLLLLMWVSIVLGILQSFSSAQFNKEFITCALDLRYTALAIVMNGTGLTSSSFLSGFLVKIFRRAGVMTLGTLVFFAYFLTLNLWKLDSSNVPVFLILALCSGFAEGLHLTQLSALYGVVFPKSQEAAFSNYRLWECVGIFIGFVWAPYLCLATVVYIIYAGLSIGIIFFFIVEYRYAKREKLFPD